MNRLALLLLLVGCARQPHWPERAPEGDRCEAGAMSEGPFVLETKIQGRTRRAVVWVPPGPGPHDVVVNLHEFRSEPLRQQHYSTWVKHAPQVNAILVGPDGRGSTWNAGECCGKAHEEQMNDVAFLDAVLDRVDAVGCTSGRVLATGIGNGAMMAQRWTCDSPRPTALVTVGGSLQQPACERDVPIPWLHYHGEKDGFIPLNGGEGILKTRPGGHRPVSHAVEVFRKRNKATDARQHQEGALRCASYAGAAPLTHCVVPDAIDTWPGAADAPADADAPLSHATTGAWAWVREAWEASTPQEASDSEPTDAPSDAPEGEPTPAPEGSQ